QQFPQLPKVRRRKRGLPRLFVNKGTARISRLCLQTRREHHGFSSTKTPKTPCAWRERNCDGTAVLLSSKRLLGYVCDRDVDGIGKVIGDKSAGEDCDNGKNHPLSKHKVVTAGIPGYLAKIPTDHREKLNSLMTHNFQTFNPALFLAA
ncbi:MAG: hypothetical protein ACYC3I_17430, partial [Gemmataceae bacterium]